MDSPFNINTLNATGGNAILGSNKASYGDNQFLVLLTEQLKNQTPFEPVDGASFNTQLASYSNMEEQRELNANMLKLLDYQGVLARSQGLSQGSQLLGKDVEYLGEDGSTATGKVQSVFVAEYTSVGNLQWSRVTGSDQDWQRTLAAAVTSDGNAYVGGCFSGTLSFGDPATSPSVDCGYVSRLIR